MRVFVRVGLLAVLVGVAWGSWVWAQPAPITGTVVQLWWAKDDLFVQLDINSDTRADLLVKIEHKTQVVDVNNRPLPLSAIVVGVTLTVTHYKWDDDGYYEAWHVVVGEASPSALQPLVGIVLEVFSFGNDLFVRLDANGDGKEDFPVKISKSAQITDPQGKPLDRSAITKGVRLTITQYELKDGYYEAKRVIVG